MPDARAVVEQLVHAINAHDLDPVRHLVAGGARLVTGSGRHVDFDGLREVLRETLGAFPDLRVAVRRWIVDGNLVVTEELLEGTHTGAFGGMPATGRRVRLPMAHVWRVERGQVVEQVAYYDTAGVLRQLSE